MLTYQSRCVFLLAPALMALVGCESCQGEKEAPVVENTEPKVSILPIEAPTDLNMDKVALGRRLYHDGMLSGDGSVSCATCHIVDAGGAEPRATSEGMGSQVGPINSPTVLNSSHNFVQFWDGRAKDLAAQAVGPVENPIEMGASFTVVVERVKEDEWYKKYFAKVYGDDGIKKENIADAIAEYERGLITPSPFDAFLKGDEKAISAEAKEGWTKFQEVGCTACHTGVNAGGTMYEKMGKVKDYFEMRGGELTEADMGRFNVTKDEDDKHKFKVPTLRNVELTAPYFHDGSHKTLEQAVKTMGTVQLAQDLSGEDVAKMVAFLKSLTGTLPDLATVPEDEIPPPRYYSTYDLRLKSGMSKKKKTLAVLGSVPAESLKENVQAMAKKAGFKLVDVEGLSVREGLSFPEGLETVLGTGVTTLGALSGGQIDLTGNAISFFGEGSAKKLEAAKALWSDMPEGWEVGEPHWLDSDAADACDASLKGLQKDETIQFKTGSADIDKASALLLNKLMTAIKACPDSVPVSIDGHTDSKGNAASNLRLSDQRARSVLNMLVKLGVDKKRLYARGYGQTLPIGDNATEEGRKENRRIELHLVR